MVNRVLPRELQDYGRVLTKGDTDKLLAQLARSDPEAYRDISHKLVQLGRNAAYEEGTTLRLSSILAPMDKTDLIAHIQQQDDRIDADKTMTPEEKQEARETVYAEVNDALKKMTYDSALAADNPFALQVKSKARGNPDQLAALMTTPGVYQDAKDNTIPVFIRHSYAEGLQPHEYWAATYGARKGVISCLTYDTQVVMADWSIRSLGSLAVGDWIMGVNRDSTVKPVRVSRIFYNGIQPVYEYVFRKNASSEFVSVKSTVKHKFMARVWHAGARGTPRKPGPAELTPIGEARFCARDSRNNYVGQLTAGLSPDATFGISEPRALLLGIILGDGCTAASTRGAITLSCADTKMVEDVRPYLNAFGLELDKSAGSNYNWTLRRVGSNIDWTDTGKNKIMNNAIRAWLWSLLGNLRADQKRLPSIVWSWDQVSCGALIAGYLATDGCVVRPRNGRGWISFGSTSRELLQDIARLLEYRFGIWTNPISSCSFDCRRPMHQLTVTHPDAIARLQLLLVVPGVKEARLKRFDATRSVERHADLGCRVQMCKYIGEVPVMDIEVDDPDHMYMLANGLISSNSKFATRQAGYLGKLFGMSVMDSVVTSDDCDTPYGIPVPLDDDDNVGSVLARPAGGFSAGTVITKDVLGALQGKKVDQVIVRSPITCGTRQGVCKQCVGVREGGKFPPMGYHIGLNAASALAEQIAQSSLNVKHCVSHYTPILYADWSVKQIKDVQVGDMVMGCGVDGHMRPVKVLNVFDNGPRECYRTVFQQNGTHGGSEWVLESTLDHKMLSTRRVASQLDSALNGIPRVLPVGTKSKWFYAILPSSYDDTGLTDEPLALLLGNLLGDGCYTEAVNGVHLSSADLTQIDTLQNYLNPLGLKLSKLQGHDYYYRVSGSNDTQADRLGNPVRNYLEKHGMWGKYAYEKELPEVVRTWNNRSIAALIGGLIVTDGSIYLSDGKNKPSIALMSTSKVMLEQVQHLLKWRFGILTTNITTVSFSGKQIRGLNTVKEYFQQHDQYQFTITSWPMVQKFHQVIPLIGVKQAKLDSLMAAYRQHRNNIPGLVRVRQEYVGMLPTMDIEVDHPDHLFVLANGLVVSNSGKKAKGQGAYTGFNVIKNIATVPQTFPDKATVSELDGKVTKIEEAPQGGYHVYVDDQQHYVPQDMAVLVKEGDTLEAGDQLSDGVINPADVVRLKGLGEGRRYFAQRLTQAFRETNFGVNRRNAEVLARSIVNHVQVDDPDAAGEHLPGDVVTYGSWAYGYRPRKDAARVVPKAAIGKYLEEPALHYTIGTRVTKSVADTFKKHGINDVLTHAQPVGVSPAMMSVVKTPEYTDDWMARLSSSYLKTRLLEDVHAGATSNVHGVHPIPGIAKGTEFGESKGKGFTY